jgi:hypothetical protein
VFILEEKLSIQDESNVGTVIQLANGGSKAKYNSLLQIWRISSTSYVYRALL